MISLISFYHDDNFMYDNKDSLNDVIISLQRNIDLLLKCGWDADRIIIKTNFEFNYLNINSQPFRYTGLKNLFLTKIVAAYEVSMEHRDEIIWQHDHDTYQIKKFDISELNNLLKNDVSMCNYWPENNKPQGASIFYKGFTTSLETLYDEVIKLDTKSSIFYPIGQSKFDDETFFLKCQQKEIVDISFDLPYQYNTSITKWTWDKRTCDKPYCIHGDIRKDFDKQIYDRYISNI